MSKSYKKNPEYTIEKSSRTDKRLANKHIRKEANNSEMKFKHFKKVPKEIYGGMSRIGIAADCKSVASAL
jgi:ABC-type transporter Mla maintaining outer membrane lipid asymmetry ATPase subunit MlaF